MELISLKADAKSVRLETTIRFRGYTGFDDVLAKVPLHKKFFMKKMLHSQKKSVDFLAISIEILEAANQWLL
jgi:hypothetical protein